MKENVFNPPSKRKRRFAQPRIQVLKEMKKNKVAAQFSYFPNILLNGRKVKSVLESSKL